jgi:hypothetical protein
MRQRIVVLIFPALMAACSVSTDCVCPAYYSPVCGENGKTYSSPCEADCDGVNYIEGECPVYGAGIVEYSGNDTCGYYIRIFGTLYKPRSLPEGFREHNLVVGIRYRRMNTWFTCDMTYGNYQEIEILEIDKL